MQLNKLFQDSKNTVPGQTLKQLIIPGFYGFFGVKWKVLLETEFHRTLWYRCSSAIFLQQLLLLKTLITSDHLTKHSYNFRKMRERRKHTGQGVSRAPLRFVSDCCCQQKHRIIAWALQAGQITLAWVAMQGENLLPNSSSRKGG